MSQINNKTIVFYSFFNDIYLCQGTENYNKGKIGSNNELSYKLCMDL